jgi:hypothetical protein
MKKERKQIIKKKENKKGVVKQSGEVVTLSLTCPHEVHLGRK